MSAGARPRSVFPAEKLERLHPIVHDMQLIVDVPSLNASLVSLTSPELSSTRRIRIGCPGLTPASHRSADKTCSFPDARTASRRSRTEGVNHEFFMCGLSDGLRPHEHRHASDPAGVRKMTTVRCDSLMIERVRMTSEEGIEWSR
jgi:hypothetical protein